MRLKKFRELSEKIFHENRPYEHPRIIEDPKTGIVIIAVDSGYTAFENLESFLKTSKAQHDLAKKLIKLKKLKSKVKGGTKKHGRK